MDSSGTSMPRGQQASPQVPGGVDRVVRQHHEGQVGRLQRIDELLGAGQGVLLVDEDPVHVGEPGSDGRFGQWHETSVSARDGRRQRIVIFSSLARAEPVPEPQHGRGEQQRRTEDEVADGVHVGQGQGAHRPPARGRERHDAERERVVGEVREHAGRLGEATAVTAREPCAGEPLPDQAEDRGAQTCEAEHRADRVVQGVAVREQPADEEDREQAHHLPPASAPAVPP